VVNRLELFILLSLGTAALIVMAGAGLLLAESISREPVPTLPLATVPPNPLLLTRAPLCQDVIGLELVEHGWPNTVRLDAQRAVLTIEMVTAVTDTQVLPADQIWAAFEATLAGRANGCAGYGTVVVQVGRYCAKVGADDLSAWEGGVLDDGALSERVELTE
jgi:hypothetical protein